MGKNSGYAAAASLIYKFRFKKQASNLRLFFYEFACKAYIAFDSRRRIRTDAYFIALYAATSSSNDVLKFCGLVDGKHTAFDIIGLL